MSVPTKNKYSSGLMPARALTSSTLDIRKIKFRGQCENIFFFENPVNNFKYADAIIQVYKLIGRSIEY